MFEYIRDVSSGAEALKVEMGALGSCWPGLVGVFDHIIGKRGLSSDVYMYSAFAYRFRKALAYAMLPSTTNTSFSFLTTPPLCVYDIPPL